MKVNREVNFSLLLIKKMKDQSIAKSIFCFLFFALIFLSSCQVKEECSKFLAEEYLDEQVDTTMTKSAPEYRDTLLKWLGETPIKGLNCSAYHLLFYSSHGFGQSIKFVKKNSGCFLRVKCVTKEGWDSNCKEYQIKITNEEWNQFEEMIYDFNFWTTVPQFKTTEGVLDGYVYLLEGKRPEAENCGKRTYRFIGRGSPIRDKIGALCDYIMEYEDQLALSYGKREIK